MPFPVDSRCVTSAVQQFGDRNFLVGQTSGAEGIENARLRSRESQTNGETTSKELSSARSADGVGVELSEAHPFCGNIVQRTPRL